MILEELMQLTPLMDTFEVAEYKHGKTQNGSNVYTIILIQHPGKVVPVSPVVTK